MDCPEHKNHGVLPEVHLYGPPQIVTSTGAVPIFDRAAQLIGLLALADDAVLRRAQAAETLWGNSHSGLVNLRQALARLKQGPSVLATLVVADLTHLRLDKEVCSIDVLQVAPATPHSKIPRGEFLDGVSDIPVGVVERGLEESPDPGSALRRTLQIVW